LLAGTVPSVLAASRRGPAGTSPFAGCKFPAVLLPVLPHNELVNVTSVTAQTATVDLSRAEAVALLNLLREAHRLPLEAIGPHEIFGRLHAEFGRLVRDMHPGR
jgi:hypothetical protein